MSLKSLTSFVRIRHRSFSNSFEGIPGVVWKSRGSNFCVLFHFYNQIFQSLFWGYIRVSPLLSSTLSHPPVFIYGIILLSYESDMLSLGVSTVETNRVSQLSRLSFKNYHRCTVVGNPVGGGGVLGVLAKFFLGGYLGLSENLVGGPLFYLFCVLLHFYVTIFWTLPLSSPLPPVCIYENYWSIFLKLRLFKWRIGQVEVFDWGGRGLDSQD